MARTVRTAPRMRKLIVLLLLSLVACDPDAGHEAAGPAEVGEIRFDSFKADAPASPTRVIATPLGAADGGGPVLELVVTDVWGRLPDRKSEVLIVHQSGRGVRLVGYLQPVLIRLDEPGRYRLTASVPEHLPETMDLEVKRDGSIPVPADTVQHWGFSAGDRKLDQTGEERVHSLYLGVEHRVFAASGPAPSRGNRVELFDNGRDAFGSLADDLDGVRRTAHLSFWLFRAAFELRRDPDYAGVSTSQRRAETILERLRTLPGTRRLLLNQFWGRSDVINEQAVLDDEVVAHARDKRDSLEVMLQANETEVPYYDRIEVNDGEWSYLERLFEVYPEWAGRRFLNEETIRPGAYGREVHWTDLQAASWHQKFVTLDGEIGYLGGMNMNWADWDQPEMLVYDPLRMPIDASTARRNEVAAGSRDPATGPRRDYMARVEGPVVGDIEALFQKRWDLAIMRRAQYVENATPFSRGAAPPPASGGVEAQLTVTLPMPFWEHSILESYRRAIAEAEDFIYIEDQYFRAPILDDLIADRMREAPELKLIVVTKPVAYLDPGRKWTAKAARRFQSEFPGRFLLLTMRSNDIRAKGGDVRATFRDVDIHSKMFIVDDRIMSIGSCNKNNRGLIYEGEANLLIYDEAYVGEYRRRIWNRLVGPHFEDLIDDPQSAFELFDQIAERNQRVLDLWDDRDNSIPGSRFNESLRPQGILYPLEVPHEWWFNVGPDFA